MTVTSIPDIRVAWRHSQSLYNCGPPSKIHILAEDGEKTLCGRIVPKQALPGYKAPSGQKWFEVRTYAVEIDDDDEWYGVGNSAGYIEPEDRICKRCCRDKR